MKVFISWSGDRSNKIAEILKDWLKKVLQSVEPFVSSQDIPKGARWSSDIAKALEDSNFGIFCVTKDNFQEPWLIFEAGALSKTLDGTYVVPLLFDLKPSDLSDSPLLQFQAMLSFSKKEIKKLVTDLNNAHPIPTLEIGDLDDVVDTWYPKLEEALAKIPAFTEAEEDAAIIAPENPEKVEAILEEILNLSRNNQKLLRSPDDKTVEGLSQISDKMDNLIRRSEKSVDSMMRKSRRYSPMFIEELMMISYEGRIDKQYVFLMVLSLIKDEIPWVYDTGRELINTLKSKVAVSKKWKLLTTSEKCLKSLYITLKDFLKKKVICFYEIWKAQLCIVLIISLEMTYKSLIFLKTTPPPQRFLRATQVRFYPGVWAPIKFIGEP